MTASSFHLPEGFALRRSTSDENGELQQRDIIMHVG
jgi:hypothetical protein